MANKRILVIGSLNMDQVTKVAHTPRVGETVHGKGLYLNPGGKGANQAVAMGKLGGDVTMIGRVGDDSNGVELKKQLVDQNVKDHVQVVEGVATGLAMIMVNANADNSIVVIDGANGALTEDLVQEQWFDHQDIVVMQLETPVDTVLKALKMAKKLGKRTVLNPAPAKVLSRELLSYVDLLIVNETEFEVLSGLKTDALSEGYAQLGVQEIVLTLGSEGARYYDGTSNLFVPAKRVDAVDTTAAGDSFIGGLVVALAKDAPVQEALEFATCVAAYTVTKFGAQNALPTLEEVMAFKHI